MSATSTSLGCLSRTKVAPVPTVGGVLLYGRDRLAHFPDAWVQAGRFGGTDKARILDQSAIRMHLADTVPAAMAFVERHLASDLAIGPVRSEPQWQVPPVAIREALVNAVAHADYSQRGAPIRVAVFDDRVEVENPRLLPFGLTIKDLPRGVSKLRNRVIGRVFHELRLVEQWGSGAQRMIAACREFGLAPPVWEEVGTMFRVTFRTERVAEAVVDQLTSPFSTHWNPATDEVPARSQAPSDSRRAPLAAGWRSWSNGACRGNRQWTAGSETDLSQGRRRRQPLKPHFARTASRAIHLTFGRHGFNPRLCVGGDLRGSRATRPFDSFNPGSAEPCWHSVRPEGL